MTDDVMQPSEMKVSELIEKLKAFSPDANASIFFAWCGAGLEITEVNGYRSFVLEYSDESA